MGCCQLAVPFCLWLPATGCMGYSPTGTAPVDVERAMFVARCAELCCAEMRGQKIMARL